MTVITKRAALVTGGAEGVGRIIALDLAAGGWNVAIQYFHRKREADELVARIRRDGGMAEAFQANLSREAEVKDLLPAACQGVGALTLLVNAAAEFADDTLATADRDSWDRHLETNLRAPFVLIQRFAAQLPAGETGCVINVLDQRVLNLTPHYISYTLSKAGLWTLTRTLALALAPRVRVNGIGPGAEFRPPRPDGEFGAAPEDRPLRRPVEAEEVAHAVRFILDTPSLTGQMLALDGGEHLGWAQPTDTAPR